MGLFETTKFDVTLEIEKISKIPHSTGRLHVRWHVRDSPGPRTRGRTKAVDVSHNAAVFDYHAPPFTQKIGVKAGSRTLRPTELHFEVLWEPPGTKAMSLGYLSLDLAEFVTPMRHKSEGDASKTCNGKFLSYLLEDAKINCLLTISIRMSYLSGPTNFTVPEFTAPAVRQNLNDIKDPHVDIDREKHHGPRENDQTIANSRDRFLLWSTALFSPVDAKTSLEDIIAGGDGFEGKTPEIPSESSEHVTGEPYREQDIRENFRSWLPSSSLS